MDAYGSSLLTTKTPEQIEVLMDQYLQSDVHARFVKDRLKSVLLKYPEYKFNEASMKAHVESLEDLVDKFSSLRNKNMDIEERLMSKDSIAGRARNIHLSRLMNFLWAYCRIGRETT